MSRSSSLRMLGSFYERLEEILLVFLVALMVFLGFLQILFRNLISIGIVWKAARRRYLEQSCRVRWRSQRRRTARSSPPSNHAR